MRTVAVIAGGDAQLWLSGTVRAHVETPLACVLIGGVARWKLAANSVGKVTRCTTAARLIDSSRGAWHSR